MIGRFLKYCAVFLILAGFGLPGVAGAYDFQKRGEYLWTADDLIIKLKIPNCWHDAQDRESCPGHVFVYLSDSASPDDRQAYAVKINRTGDYALLRETEPGLFGETVTGPHGHGCHERKSWWVRVMDDDFDCRILIDRGDIVHDRLLVWHSADLIMIDYLLLEGVDGLVYPYVAIRKDKNTEGTAR